MPNDIRKISDVIAVRRRVRVRVCIAERFAESAGTGVAQGSGGSPGAHGIRKTFGGVA